MQTLPRRAVSASRNAPHATNARRARTGRRGSASRRAPGPVVVVARARVGSASRLWHHHRRAPMASRTALRRGSIAAAEPALAVGPARAVSVALIAVAHYVRAIAARYVPATLTAAPGAIAVNHMARPTQAPKSARPARRLPKLAVASRAPLSKSVSAMDRERDLAASIVAAPRACPRGAGRRWSPACRP